MGTIGAMKRIRTVIYLDKKEHDDLSRLSKETGAPITELVRRAIKEWQPTAFLTRYAANRKKK
jgi:hypothetical protein